jgi:hypothetical protein
MLSLPPNAIRALPYLLCFALGFGTSQAIHSDPEPIVVTHTVEKLVEAKRETATVLHVTTTTTKPDGTKVVKQEDKQQTVKQERETTQKEAATESRPTTPAKSSYSLGLSYLPSLTSPPSFRDVQIEVGARMGGSNLWVTGGYDIKDKQASVGLRYEW